MRFNSHKELEGFHAFLSASKYHWIRYDDEKFREKIRTSLASSRGTQLHYLAKTLINLKVRLQKNGTTLNMYVNDAIGLFMTPEVLLFATPVAFGTADAIGYNEEKRILRIHDLKTGVNTAKVDQLSIYAAYWFIEYGDYLKVAPENVEMEFRIYQND